MHCVAAHHTPRNPPRPRPPPPLPMRFALSAFFCLRTPQNSSSSRPVRRTTHYFNLRCERKNESGGTHTRSKTKERKQTNKPFNCINLNEQPSTFIERSDNKVVSFDNLSALSATILTSLST